MQDGTTKPNIYGDHFKGAVTGGLIRMTDRMIISVHVRWWKSQIHKSGKQQVCRWTASCELTRQPLASGPAERVGRTEPDSLTFSLQQQRHLSHILGNTLSNKPLIPQLLFPVEPVNIWFNTGWSYSLSPPFPWCQSRSRCPLVIYFMAAKKINNPNTLL